MLQFIACSRRYLKNKVKIEPFQTIFSLGLHLFKWKVNIAHQLTFIFED